MNQLLYKKQVRPPMFNPFEKLVESMANGIETTTEKIANTQKTIQQRVKTVVVDTYATTGLISAVSTLLNCQTITSYDLSKIELHSAFNDVIGVSPLFRSLYFSALYKSIPGGISDDVWRFISNKHPHIDNGRNNGEEEYEDILQKYTKFFADNSTFWADAGFTAGGFLVNLTKFIQEKGSKLSFGVFKDMIPDFHIQAAIFVVVWTKMLWDLSKCKKLNWSRKQVANMATTIVIALLQVLVREFPYTKPIVSAVRTSYGVFADIISNLPEDMKQKCPNVIKDAAPTWHKELAEAMNTKSYLSYGQALNMLYTFRVGDNYVTQIKRDLDENTIVRTLTALSPFPIDGEERRLVHLHQHKAIY